MDAGAGTGDDNPLLTSAYEAVEHARRYEPARLPQALTNYVRLLTREGLCQQAVSFAEEVLALEKHTENAVESIIVLGICRAYSDRLDEASEHFIQAAELSRKINYTMGISRSMLYYARMVLLVRGQFSLALTLVEESGILRETLGSRHWSEPFIRGLIYQITGDRRHCRQVLDELVLQVEPGTRLAAAYYLLWARLALDEEEPEQAKEYLRLGLRVANRIRAADLNLFIRLEFSRYFRAAGDAPVALTWAEDALIQARHYGFTYFIGLACIEHAQAAWDAGIADRAEKDLDEAVKILTPLSAGYDLARAIFLRAWWYQQAERVEAEPAWLEAVSAITQGGFAFILEKEQEMAFPLIAYHARSKTPEIRKATERLLANLANVAPPPLRIATLGQFAVWKGRRRIPDAAWSRRKAGELLRYLLLQPTRSAGREVIIEAIWPDHPSDSPADLLHQATSALRHALEPDLPDKFPSRYLKVEGEQISLFLPPGSIVDFEHFERALPQAIQTRNADRLQEALNLYSGELFPSDRYADWSAEKRQSLAELRQRGILALAQTYLAKSQFYNAINCCRQIMHSDSWNEDAVLFAMQAYAGLQDVPQALLIYKNLEQTLREELDISPRSDLCALAEILRKR